MSAGSRSANERDPKEDTSHVGPAVVDASLGEGEHDGARVRNFFRPAVVRDYRHSKVLGGDREGLVVGKSVGVEDTAEPY